MLKTSHFAGSLAALLFATLAPPASAQPPDLSKPVPRVETRKPVPLQDTRPHRIQFVRWVSAIPAGTVIGLHDKSTFVCGEGKPMHYGPNNDAVFRQRVQRGFEDLATEYQFTRKPGQDSVFEADPSNAVDFRLGVTMLALDYRVCERTGTKGAAWGRFKWELFSLREQRVVYSAEIEGSVQTDEFMPSGDFSRLFGRNVASNLLADPAFADALRGNTKLAQASAPAALQIATGPTVPGPVAKSGEALLQAVVTVESGIGSGSGFFIGREGYLLTNLHVVADAKFVRVKLANGRAVVGEVLRVDRARDVALLRTEAATAPVLAVRQGDPQIGEDVYAIGSPYGAVLSGSMTRGVLSARRVLESLPFLQSDVAVNPGNSGGPLVDLNGQVIGIAQLGRSGINLFIPIGEALQRLGLQLQADGG